MKIGSDKEVLIDKGHKEWWEQSELSGFKEAKAFRPASSLPPRYDLGQAIQSPKFRIFIFKMWTLIQLISKTPVVHTS